MCADCNWTTGMRYRQTSAHDLKPRADIDLKCQVGGACIQWQKPLFCSHKTRVCIDGNTLTGRHRRRQLVPGRLISSAAEFIIIRWIVTGRRRFLLGAQIFCPCRATRHLKWKGMCLSVEQSSSIVNDAIVSKSSCTCSSQNSQVNRTG